MPETPRDLRHLHRRPDGPRPPTGRRRALAGTAVVLVGLLTACGAPAADAPPPAPPQHQPAGGELTAQDVDAWLDGVVPTGLRTSGIPGAAVTVVADGEILTTRGYGLADTGTTGDPVRAVDPDATLFRVGSVAKAVTATAVLQLVEQGELDLDADVEQYLDVDLDLPRGPVTLRHLLTHSAGFEERLRGLLTYETGESLRETVVTDQPAQVFEPGTVPSYSNYGLALAGYVVERVTGAPFDEHVARHVLEPAGMTSSSFAQPLPDDLVGRLSRGYEHAGEPPVPFEHVAASPAGSLSATASDMGRFMLLQLGESVTGATVVGPETLELMHAPALGEDDLGTLARDRTMALGFFDETRDGRTAVGHDGDTQVFHAAMRFFPEDGVGVFVALNGTGRDSLDAHELRLALVDGFADRYLPSAGTAQGPAPDDGTASDGAGRAAAVAGAYGSARMPFTTFASILRLTSQVQVTPRSDGTLLVSPHPERLTPAVYAEVEPWVWQEVGGRDRITARTEDGRVTVLGAGPAATLLRLDAAHDAAAVLPVVGAALVVLVAASLAWPVGALLRRRHGVPGPGRRGRLLRVLTRVGVGSALVGTLSWVGVILAATSFQAVPDVVLRLLQVVQGVGMLAVVPASWQLVEAVRSRYGVPVVLGRLLLVLALGALAWFAVVFRLVGLSVTY